MAKDGMAPAAEATHAHASTEPGIAAESRLFGLLSLKIQMMKAETANTIAAEPAIRYSAIEYAVPKRIFLLFAKIGMQATAKINAMNAS